MSAVNSSVTDASLRRDIRSWVSARWEIAGSTDEIPRNTFGEKFRGLLREPDAKRGLLDSEARTR
jgi:hypothetical protein